MRANFDACLRELWRMEGGYVDDARDAGGATKYGITISTLGAWRKRAVTKGDVQALTRDEAADIYRAWYWAPVKADDLPAGMDAVAFDAAVNSGVSRSAKWLQGALGVTADGKIGPQTIAAARKADRVVAINRALDARLAFMKVAKNRNTGALLWPTYKNGWQRRIDELRAFALHLSGDQRPEPKPLPKPAILPRPVDPHPPADIDKTIIRPLAVLAILAVIAAIFIFAS